VSRNRIISTVAASALLAAAALTSSAQADNLPSDPGSDRVSARLVQVLNSPPELRYDFGDLASAQSPYPLTGGVSGTYRQYKNGVEVFTEVNPEDNSEGATYVRVTTGYKSYAYLFRRNKESRFQLIADDRFSVRFAEVRVKMTPGAGRNVGDIFVISWSKGWLFFAAGENRSYYINGEYGAFNGRGEKLAPAEVKPVLSIATALASNKFPSPEDRAKLPPAKPAPAGASAAVAAQTVPSTSTLAASAHPGAAINSFAWLKGHGLKYSHYTFQAPLAENGARLIASFAPGAGDSYEVEIYTDVGGNREPFHGFDTYSYKIEETVDGRVEVYKRSIDGKLVQLVQLVQLNREQAQAVGKLFRTLVEASAERDTPEVVRTLPARLNGISMPTAGESSSRPQLPARTGNGAAPRSSAISPSPGN
jgi:hypothetical protein